MIEMPLGELRCRDSTGHGVEQSQNAVRAIVRHGKHRAMHDLVQQHGEIEDCEAGDERERQPEVPAVELNDRYCREAQNGEVCERDQRVQPRPLLMQHSQIVGRELRGEVAFQLLCVIGVVGRHRYSVINTSSAPGYSKNSVVSS